MRAVMWTIALRSQGGAVVSQAATSQRGGSSAPVCAADGGAAGARAGAAGTAGENSPCGGGDCWASARGSVPDPPTGEMLQSIIFARPAEVHESTCHCIGRRKERQANGIVRIRGKWLRYCRE